MSLCDMPGLLMQVLMAQEDGPVVRGLQQGRGAPHVPAQGLAPHTHHPRQQFQVVEESSRDPQSSQGVEDSSDDIAESASQGGKFGKGYLTGWEPGEPGHGKEVES